MLNDTQIKYIDVFFASAQKILNSELSISLIKRSASLRNSTRPSYPCCVSIGFFVGNALTGQVVYAMSNTFANYIVQGMLPNTEPADQKRLQNSCIGELGNMISGRATREIASTQQVMKMTPPTVFYSRGAAMGVDFVKIPTTVLILDSEHGALEINIGLQERSA